MVDVGQSRVRRVTPRRRVKVKAKSEVRLQCMVDAVRSLVNLSDSVEKTFRLPSDRMLLFWVGRPFVIPLGGIRPPLSHRSACLGMKIIGTQRCDRARL